MRDKFLPFSTPSIGEDAIEDIADSIRSGWIAMGPKTMQFEKAFGEYVGSAWPMSCNSGTAALHLAVMALGLGPGDEVITTPMTFASTVNVILFAGAKPLLADIDRNTLNIDPKKIEAVLTPATKAIIPVHFAGRPCDMDAIEAIAAKHNLAIIEDAAHAIGTSYKGRRIGGNRGERHLAAFSFHPTKNITTGEGGMLCTEDEGCAEKVQVLRQNGMSKGSWNRYAASGAANYDIPFPGLKYTMTDIQAAIGNSQIKHLDEFNARRRELVAFYMKELASVDGLILPAPVEEGSVHSWHIFTPLVDIDRLTISRDEFMARMKKLNIGTALHYQALHLYGYYANLLGLHRGSMPESEFVSDRILSLPLCPKMTNADARDVVEAIHEVLDGARK